MNGNFVNLSSVFSLCNITKVSHVLWPNLLLCEIPVLLYYGGEIPVWNNRWNDHSCLSLSPSDVQ